jgi:hypothetical protein
MDVNGDTPMKVAKPMANVFARELLELIRGSHARIKFANQILFCNKLFPKKVNINKFIGGFVVEELFTRMLNELGLPCKNTGAITDIYDIEIGDYKYSLKSTSRLGTDIIIRNHRGDRGVVLPVEPTFLIYTSDTKVNIMYIDQESIDACDYTYKKVKQSDAITSISGGCIRYMANKEMGIIEIQTDDVPDAEAIDPATFLTDYISMMYAEAKRKPHE